MKTILISAFSEDVRWLEKVKEGNQIIVYRKNEEFQNFPFEHIKKNEGREQGSFFDFIVDNYKNLPESVLFCQGDPFDHVKNFIEIANDDKVAEKNARLEFEGFKAFADDKIYKKNFLTCGKDGAPHHQGLNIQRIWEKLFLSLIPERFSFVPGGTYEVSRKNILTNSIGWYKLASELAKSSKEAPHVFERLVYYVYCPDFKKKCIV